MILFLIRASYQSPLKKSALNDFKPYFSSGASLGKKHSAYLSTVGKTASSVGLVKYKAGVNRSSMDLYI